MPRSGTRRLSTFFALFVLLLAGPALAAPADRPTVQTRQGQAVGAIEGGLRVFRGLPYALPPVGERRWRQPEPPAAWSGPRDAAAFGPACQQPAYPAASVYFEPLPALSEDCLTLNVWTPPGAAGAPVIVWIHGGSLTYGSAASPMYDGGEFARRGVVFVSINYRLGVFGWLAHPALSAESPRGISGNYGLLDQIAALQWVRDNIAAFGGDPARVTVMGESAGALSITYLLSSPDARGLFARAIVESPNIRAVPRLREPVFGLPPAEATGAALAASLGAADLAALRALGPEALIEAAARTRFVSQGTIDGVVLPDQVVEVFDQGRQARVPVLIGFNSGETRSQRLLAPKPPETEALYRDGAARTYGDLAPDFLRLYPPTDMEASLLTATRDAIYGWASERMVRQQTAAGLPAYLYIFDHCYPAARARDLCAFHASELPFVFGRTGDGAALPPNWPAPVGDGDQALADRMIAYWVRFASAGAPGDAGGPDWPAYGQTQAYMRFGATPAALTDPEPGMFELQEAVSRRRRCHGQQWFINLGPAAPPLTSCPDETAP
ncbi:MAG: carboxylesterase family protein [Caulobacter sp.]|nr:carboxylesterase family protein [Caulobacter sp.]